jgi:U3 small nucleolar RNA-associated protein 11
MSLKHVVHRRVHKERHQPAARQRLGYLEKHKDYVKRAKDFHRKEDHIKKLHQKAYFKNEDEFSFGMLSHKMDGKRLTKQKDPLSQDEMKLVESQDACYINMREQIDKKAVQKQSERLHFLNASQGPKQHVLFIDEDEDDDINPGTSTLSSSIPGSKPANGKRKKRLEDFNVAAHFDTHPALLGRRSNRLRLSQLEKGNFEEQSAANKEAYRELFHRQERAKKLGRVRQELTLRRDLRSKGKRMKVSDEGKDKPAVYKWFPERKR